MTKHIYHKVRFEIKQQKKNEIDSQLVCKEEESNTTNPVQRNSTLKLSQCGQRSLNFIESRLLLRWTYPNQAATLWSCWAFCHFDPLWQLRASRPCWKHWRIDGKRRFLKAQTNTWSRSTHSSCSSFPAEAVCYNFSKLSSKLESLSRNWVPPVHVKERRITEKRREAWYLKERVSESSISGYPLLGIKCEKPMWNSRHKITSKQHVKQQYDDKNNQPV